MLPLYLHYFNVATYGAWLAAGSVISMLALIEPGIATVTTQRLAVCHASGDKLRFADIFGSALLISVIFGLIIMGTGILLSPLIPRWINCSPDQQSQLASGLRWSAIGTGIAPIFYLLSTVPQTWQRTVVSGIIGLLALIANLATIVLALRGGWNIAALGLGSAALSFTYTAGFLFYLAYFWHRLGFPNPTVSISTSMELWSDAKLLLFAKLAGAFGKYLEAPAVALAVAPEAAAILVITGRVVTSMQIFIDRIGIAVFAGIAGLSRPESKGRALVVLREILTVSTVVSGLALAFSLAFTKGILTLWVGERMFGGTPLLVVLALSSFLTTRKELLSCFMIAFGETKCASHMAAMEAVIRVILIPTCVLQMGTVGIPLAGAIAALLISTALSYRLVMLFGSTASLAISPGLKSFILSTAIGLSCMLFLPMGKTWASLFMQALSIGILLLLASCSDSEWLAAVRQTTGEIWDALRLKPVASDV